MSNTLANDRLMGEARRQLDDWRRLKGELPAVREEHTRSSFELRRIEACMSAIEQQRNALQSFSLTSILGALTGQKQRSIDEHNEALAALEAELGTAQQTVESFTSQIEWMEAELAALAGAEVAYRDACDERTRRIIDAGGAQADRLQELTARLGATRTSLRAVQKAQETGRQLFKHLESLDRTVRNARTNRRMSTAVGGPVGGIIKNAVASMGPKSAIRYVDDGLKRFCRELGELPLGDRPDDAELIRIRAELDLFQVRLSTELNGITSWDEIATLPTQQDVQLALSYLKTLSTELEQQIADSESAQLTLIAPP